MSTSGPGPSPEQASGPLTVSAAEMAAGPGIASLGRVPVTNGGPVPASVSLAVVGIDPAWVEVAPPGLPLQPGETRVVAVRVTVPAGHPPCRLIGQIVVTDDLGRSDAADLAVVIADGTVLSIAVDPPDVRGGSRGRTTVILRNRGRTPVRADLDASAPDPGLKVNLGSRSELLPPGAEVRVRARLSANRPVGAPARRPFVVSASTGGTPVSAEATFTSRPVFSPGLTRAVAVVAVIAVWVAAAVVGINALNHHLSRTAANKAQNGSPAASPSSPNNGSGAGSGGGAGGGTTGGGSAAGGAAGAAAAAAPFGGRMSGKVTAPNPGGVTVTVTPSSLSAAGTPPAGATLASARIPAGGSVAYSLAAASTASGKLYGAALPAGSVLPKTSGGATSMGTTTAPDGSWAIEGITTPGYYQVTFSKAGYATASYVVNVPLNGKPVTLAARMVTGNGGLSGTVSGPSGPLGGVLITITDGTVSLTTRTPTVGSTGTWAVQGLTTPDTYLITATLPGYGTATSLVTLAAGGTSGGNAITMTPGVGSLSGLIVSASTSAPVGGVTVTASNASVTRTTTTTTDGPVGTYALPDLPVPGTYALTVSGPGWISQTQQVTLSADPAQANATVNARLTSSGSEVSGVASDGNGVGLPGAGVVLANADNKYKTLTTSAAPVGSYDFGQVVPGQYVLTVEDFGYTTRSAQVTIGPGQATTVDLSLPYVGATNVNTGTITGTIESLLTAKAISGVQISLDGQPTGITTTSTGTYQLTGVGPGVHAVTAACPVTAPCQSLDLGTGKVASSAYETTSVSVTVPLGAAAFAPSLLMPTLDRLTGVVLTVGGAPVPNPVLVLTNPVSGVTYQPNPAPTASGATPAQGGFEFDALPHGTYTLKISGPASTTTGACATGSLYQSTTVTVTMPIGSDVVLSGSTSPRLNVNPIYSVRTSILPPDGSAAVPTAGVSITLTDQNPLHPYSQTCTSNATVTQVPLPANLIGDQFVANFKYTDSTTTPATTYTAPQSQPLVDAINNSQIDAALLVPPSPNVTLSLKFPFRSSTGVITCTAATTAVAPCPALTQADMPTVTIAGTYVTAGGSTSTKTVAATTNGSGVWIWTMPNPSPPTALLQPGPVLITAGGGAFYVSTIHTSTTTSGYTNQSILLNPLPTQVTGVVNPASGSTVTVSPVISGLSVTTDAVGNLVWNDTASSPGAALPGVYSLTFTHAGYDPATIPNVAIGLCASASCTDSLGTITLTAHVTMSVTPVFTPFPNEPYPTVILTDHTGAQVGSVNLSASTTTATFKDLSITGNDYTVTVRGFGFRTATVSNIALSASQPVTPVSPALTPEGWFTGTVDSSINSGTPTPLPGVTVTATLQSANGCTSGVPTTLSAVTGTNGSYVLAPDPSTGDGGLCPGSTWTVAATAPTGYTAPATAVTMPAVTTGANPVDTTNGGPIVLSANLVKETFTVKGYSNNLLTGVQVIGSSPIGRTVTGTTAPDGTVVLNVDPTSYQFSFTLVQYNPFTESKVFGVGEADQNDTVTMSLHQNTIKGTISTPNPGGGACGATTCPMGGMTLALIDGSNNTVGTATTLSDGTYTISNILDGGYTLEVTNLGNYSYATGSASSFATNASGTTVQNESLAANPQQVAITVTSNIGVDQTGNLINLVPTKPPSGQSLTCTDGSKLLGTGNGVTEVGTVAASTASITGVRPDFYTVTAGGSVPTPQPPASLLVCPGGGLAYYAPGVTTPAATATYQVQEGRLTGHVAVIPGDGIMASDVTVTATPAGGSGVAYSVSCSNSGCSQGTFSTGLLALTTPATAYSITAATSASGYASSPASLSATLSAASPPSGPTDVGTINVDPTNRSVSLTIEDSGTGTLLPGATVTLTDSILGKTFSGITGTGGSAGLVTITGVEPDMASSYAITVTAGGTTLTPNGAVKSVTVPVGSGTYAGGTVTVPYDPTISGTISAPTGTTVTVQVCSSSTSCSGPHLIASDTTSGSTWTSGPIPPGSYWVQASTTGGGTLTTTASQPVTVGIGGTGTVNFTYVAPPTTTTTTTTAPTTTTTTVPPTTTTTSTSSTTSTTTSSTTSTTIATPTTT